MHSMTGEWHALLAEKLRAENIAVVTDRSHTLDGIECGELVLTVSGSRLELNLEGAPPNERLRLRIKQRRPGMPLVLTLVGFAGTELELYAAEATGLEHLNVRECSGAIHIVEQAGGPLQLSSTTRERMGGAVRISSQGLIAPNAEFYESRVTLEIIDGRLSPTYTVARLLLTGRCQLVGGSLRIERLIVAGHDAQLDISSIRGSIHIEAVHGNEGDGYWDSELVGPPEPGSLTFVSAQEGRVTVEMAFDVQLEATAPVLLTGLRNAKRCEFGGSIHARFRTEATASDVRFSAHGANVPALSAGENAVLAGLGGVVLLGQIKGAHLAGGAHGFTIEGRDTQSWAGLTPAAPDWSDCVITGFALPKGLRGRSLLALLASVFHLDPYAKNVPGWDLRLRVGRANRTARYLGSEGTGNLHQDLEFVRELSRLSAEKGAPGSTRTKIAWCAYRLRTKKARGPERAALTVYRLLGYGERPAPALLTWLVISVIGAGLTLGHWNPTWSGVWTLARESVLQATGPLVGLLRAGSPAADQWEYVLRAVIAVPLITGALALRNFVKD